jgi:hypothetical protein
LQRAASGWSRVVLVGEATLLVRPSSFLVDHASFRMDNASISVFRASLSLGRENVFFFQNSFIETEASVGPMNAASARGQDALRRAGATLLVPSDVSTQGHGSDASEPRSSHLLKRERHDFI